MFAKYVFVAALAAAAAAADSPDELAGGRLAKLGGLTQAQTAAFAGAYKAFHRGDVYNMVVADAGGEFIVAGFFERRREAFLQRLDAFAAQPLTPLQQSLCAEARAELARHCEGAAAQESFCTLGAALHRRADLRFHREVSGDKGGVLFAIENTGALQKLDLFERLKGNILLPEKEYVLHSLVVDEEKQLKEILFKETGFTQFFTRETLEFHKDSAAPAQSVVGVLAGVFERLRGLHAAAGDAETACPA